MAAMAAAFTSCNNQNKQHRSEGMDSGRSSSKHKDAGMEQKAGPQSRLVTHHQTLLLLLFRQFCPPPQAHYMHLEGACKTCTCLADIPVTVYEIVNKEGEHPHAAEY
eukprot:1155914-Pelagomonas_calceolata.AAC.1